MTRNTRHAIGFPIRERGMLSNTIRLRFTTHEHTGFFYKNMVCVFISGILSEGCQQGRPLHRTMAASGAKFQGAPCICTSSLPIGSTVPMIMDIFNQQIK